MILPGQKLALVCAVALAGTVGIAQLAHSKKKESPPAATGQISEQERALHALNRLTFGPRPGEVQRVAAMGVDKWIDLQLTPEKIDDSALTSRLSQFDCLRMSPHELVEHYPSPFMIKAAMDGKRPLPSDPSERAVYESQMRRIEQKQQAKAESSGAPAAGATSSNDPSGDPMMASAPPPGASSASSPTPAQVPDSSPASAAATRSQQIAQLPPDERVNALAKLSPSDRQQTIQALKQQKNNNFTEGMSPSQKATLESLASPQQVLMRDLVEAKLTREIYSERQLQEVMDDFWFNHFNVFAGKGPVRYYAAEYERKVIQPHAMGKFEDLLVATAKSPAMLFYLDNWMSEGPASDAARGMTHTPYRNAGLRRFPMGGMGMPYPGGYPRRPQQMPPNRGKRAASGLNENYGRELMELHTLGVNGGYTQKDVTEVARVFTGWTIERPQQSGNFKFDGAMHEPGNKFVLDHKIKNHGEKEGLEVLHILAHHPSTAKFICTKLATRFVSDNPPPALVARMSDTFLKKDGDIREVLRTMFHSPEFWSQDAYRAKVKTPLEFVVSAVRATGADVTDAGALARQLNQFGMPPYMMAPPTGYSMKAETWVNSSALLGRMNFALALTDGRLRGVEMDEGRLDPDVATAASKPPVLGPLVNASASTETSDPHQTLAVLENSLLGGDVSKQTHETISKQLDQPQVSRRRLDDPNRPPDVGLIAGLILGSPEFQRR
jgi:uncharacterized protein (DUF1800 family)